MRGGPAVLIGLLIVAACAPDGEAPSRTSVGDSRHVVVTATRDLTVSANPLGDTGTGSLGAGESATADCFVASATTNTGAKGSAVRVTVEDVSGFAAVAIRDPESGELVAFLEQSEKWLRGRLPEC
jgi:hypothetical protein